MCPITILLITLCAQVRKFGHKHGNSDGHISHLSSEPDSMALTTLNKEDKKDKKKKKEKKIKDKKKDKKLQEPFLGGASNKADKVCWRDG